VSVVVYFVINSVRELLDIPSYRGTMDLRPVVSHWSFILFSEKFKVKDDGMTSLVAYFEELCRDIYQKGMEEDRKPGLGANFVNKWEE
jgi:hypothetical protein